MPDAVHLALRCSNSAPFLLTALISAKSPIGERNAWEFCLAFHRVLSDRGASGSWRIANLIFWLSFGEQDHPFLTVADICTWTGHSERSARRHLDRLTAGGFIGRRLRSRISTWPGDEYWIPEPILIEAETMRDALNRASPLRPENIHLGDVRPRERHDNPIAALHAPIYSLQDALGDKLVAGATRRLFSAL
jgi:hypothetical protein